MDFDEAPETAMLRESVAKVTATFGPGYYQEQAATGGTTTALWEALGDAGFIGVNLPEQHGGGGMGISELAVVCEETAAGGNPLLLLLVSSAICGEVIKRFGTDDQQAAMVPGHGRRPGEDGLRHHRARRRLELPPHLHPGGQGRRRVAPLGAPRRTSPGWTRRPGCSSWPARVPPTTGAAQLSLFVVDSDAPGSSGCTSRSRWARPRSSSSCSSTTSGSAPTVSSERWATACAWCSAGSTRSGSPAPPSRTASPATPWPRPRPTPASGRCGISRSAPTRVSAIPWPRPPSTWSWPG